jgi:predicted nucleic acid-binding protein
MLVADASALLDVLLRIESVPRLADRLLAPGGALHAPHLVDVEISHALRRLVRTQRLLPARAAQALEVLASLRLRRWPHLPLVPRMWSLRDNLTAYDAAYVALAESLRAPLVTRDARLAGAAGLRAEVELY